ncbi:hypothetical protein N7495_006119 [Penicillium taxi]|uniref:uncharacterized protein n=1 Tax=Penicillium taxi TaxID=168475 RepID=UPI002545712C|nr:uncharacterized protein N7495_006119 [Penicillium taxi]KAJ5894428.1 hypothetical protein N7495_006119 [Penicillium taxi]
MLYEYFAPIQASQIPFFKASVILTGLASIMELSIEPFFAIIQQRMWYEKRAAVEMPAAFLRSLTTCSAFFYASHVSWDLGALPFALGYLSYSVTLVCGYCLLLVPRAGDRRFSFLPSSIQYGTSSEYIYGRFSRRLISLAASVFLQSIVKHLLTQGDIMFLAAMSTLEDQGIYSLASNYGGLIARILFQPLEESSRNLFSALLSPDNHGDRDKAQIRRAKAHLIDILRAYQLMSITIFPLGPVMVSQMLRILGGRQWDYSQVADLLSIYCQYIPFLALNGITEAFVSSAANSREIRKQTVWMGGFSACYGVASYIFLEVASMGAYGLVLANMVNMAVRTLWSYVFIRSYFCEYGDGLTIGEVSLHLRSYVLGAIATIIMATQPRQGLISTIAFCGGYTLLL